MILCMSHRANILLLEMLVNRGMKVVDFDQFYKVSLVKVNKNSRRQTKIMKADRRFYPPSLIKKEQKPEV